MKFAASLALTIVLLGVASKFALSLPLVPSSIEATPILAPAQAKKKGGSGGKCFETCMKNNKSPNPAKACQMKCG